MIDKSKIIAEFQRIKSLGYVKSLRPSNKDGGIGNTFEDYLGVTENNLRLPDFEGFEVKSKRAFNTSYITLFSKSPSHPKGANAILKDKFGEVRDPDFPLLKKLYASIFGNRSGLVYNNFYMKLNVDRKSRKLILHITDKITNEVYDEVYWDFDVLEYASSKMKSLFVVYANQKEIDDVYHYHYEKATIFLNFNFDKFIDCVENGKIMFDIRIGVHKSGSNYGKPHDHGSGFRVKKENISDLYEEVFEIN